MTTNTLSEPIKFADDTSFIISSKQSDNFHTRLDIVLSQMRTWFSGKKLALNLDKTNTIKFIMYNSLQCTLSAGYNVKDTEESVNTKFLGLQIDNQFILLIFTV
jgi:hypothetical protein